MYYVHTPSIAGMNKEFLSAFLSDDSPKLFILHLLTALKDLNALRREIGLGLDLKYFRASDRNMRPKRYNEL